MTRIEALRESLRVRGVDISIDTAEQVLRDLDRHAREQRMPRPTVLGITIVENPAVPEGEMRVFNVPPGGNIGQPGVTGRKATGIIVDDIEAQPKLCPYHGNDYRPSLCVYCDRAQRS